MLEETLKGSSPAAPDLGNPEGSVVAGQPATLEETSLKESVVAKPPVAPLYEKEKASKAQTAKQITSEGTVQADSATSAPRIRDRRDGQDRCNARARSRGRWPEAARHGRNHLRRAPELRKDSEVAVVRRSRDNRQYAEETA